MSQRVVTDHYDTLGVPYNAPLKEINSAYKRLALKHHPDKAGGGDIDEFQRIQQAAETLRDPIRRRRYDHELRVHRVKIQQGPGPVSGSGSGSGYYSRWMPSSVRSFNMGSRGYRYMYSYGNSVHMNPDSKDSVAERERAARERKLDEEIRQGKSNHGSSSSNDEEFEQTAQKPEKKSHERFEDKPMRRQEAMKARVVRDEEELDNEGGQGESEQRGKEHERKQEGKGHGGFGKEEFHEEKSEEKDGDERQAEPIPTPLAYDENEQESEGEDEYENENDSIIPPDAQSASEYGTAQESEASGSNTEDSISSPNKAGAEDEDITIFYDCKQSHLSNNTDTAASSQNDQTLESETSDEEDEDEGEDEEEEEQEDKNINNTNNAPNVLTPFFPYLMAKLNDPSGKYTKEDLHVELRGIIMETYCGWLEGLRLSFPDAKPQQHTTVSSENAQGCLHLGYWEKTFGCPECEVCHRWKPIYTLTCRGCGIKACVGCKFQYENKA